MTIAIKHIAGIICAFLAAATVAQAGSIRSIAVNLSLAADGSAHVTEVWDISADGGTEWYLTRGNLDGMEIRDFTVSGDGVPFTNIGSWDVDRSLSEKAGKCGIVRKRNGVELCWGLGSYGDHIFTVSYTMTGAVRSLSDYDALHLQVVSPGLSSRPEKVSVRVSAEGVPLSTANCRVWGFGFEGESALEDGCAVFRSTERFRYESSVIVLLRFDKGIFSSSNTLDKSFDDLLDEAFEGSSFSSDTDDGQSVFILFLLFVTGTILLAVVASRSHYRSILGVPSKRQIDWCRDVPFNGDELVGDFVWRKLTSGASQDSPLAGAMILRMVEKGLISVSKDSSDKIELHFSPSASFDGFPGCYKELFDMMKEASDSDQILQNKEFSRWSKSHIKRIDRWCNSVKTDATAALSAAGWMSPGGKFSDSGKNQARTLVGFSKFLKEFTLIGERGTRDAGLWNDYLVFGMIFGIADKVAKELSDIDPVTFSQTVFVDPGTAGQIIRMSTRLGYSITNASASAQMKAASAGYGGHTSFGGGGGFSSGGFGGGAR